MTRKQFFPLAALQHNLRRLLAIRLIIFACQLAATLYARFTLELSLDYTLLGTVFILFVLINLGLSWRLKQPWPVTHTEFLGHLLMDVAGLSLLLYLGGGATNPFVSYFLVPITISAAILPWHYTWTLAGVSLLSYTVLLFVYRPLPALMPMEMEMGGSNTVPNLHIVGMWFNFLVSATLITYFVVKMAQEIRSREAALTRYREDNLRNEQILAVATQAAGTAHELGTPLGTLAVVLKEMENEYRQDETLLNQIALLQQQVAVCKDHLKTMVHQADIRKVGIPNPLPLDLFVKQVLDQWQLLRPEVKLNLDLSQGMPPPVPADSTLQQAIVNLLNNAADASPERVDVSVNWNNERWTMHIRDYGDGIPGAVLESMGARVMSTKSEGLGVGFILSQASINRLNGEVLIFPHRERGTVTEIGLPTNEAG